MTALVIALFALIILFVLIKAIISPRWPVHEHYPAIEQAVMQTRPLLESDTTATHDADDPGYSVSFDHINNLGFMTYIVNLSRHDLDLLPDGVTCESFAPISLQQNNADATHTHTDLVVLGHRVSIKRDVLIRAMFEEQSAAELLYIARGMRGARLRELQHDAKSGEVSFMFYLGVGQLGLKRGSTPEEFLAQAAESYANIVSPAIRWRPRHERSAAQWAEIYMLLPSSQGDYDMRHEVLTHILARYDREPEVSTLCKNMLARNLYADHFTLFRHDPKRFFDAISPEMLERFAQKYTTESDAFLTGPRTITPERFPEVFGDHLPVGVLANTKIPTIYRVELVKRWLEDDRVDRDALHEAIASMSKRDQLQIRAALDTDNALKGALSTSLGEAGQITMSEGDREP